MKYETEYIKPLASLLDEHKNMEAAIPMAQYMKDKFSYFGIQRPTRQILMKQFLADYGLPETDKLTDVFTLLWNQAKREFQYCGLEILYKTIRKVPIDFIDVLDYLIVTKSWWDTVDMIAQKGSGVHLERYPELREQTVEKWLSSEDIWLNRTAILFQNRYKEKTDTQLLARTILMFNGSDEFFHQKAIGWALREYSKTNPMWVTEFISGNPLKPLSKREAEKHIRKRL